MKLAPYNTEAMTIYSMTGFGVANAATPSGMASVEIRSVNSRFSEFSARLPDECKGFEQAMRDLISPRLPRGKIELKIALSRLETGRDGPSLQPDRLAEVLDLTKRVRQEAGELVSPWSMADLLRWPGVLGNEGMDPVAFEAAMLALATRALEALETARAREGAKLAASIEGRLANIKDLAATAGPLVPAVLEQIRDKTRQRLREAFADLAPASVEALIEDRIRQEAHVASVRFDIAEELDRIAAHVCEMTRILAENRGQPVGKRLDFLTQELHREANTLGSKSPSLALTQLAIEMKLAIEQIREQVQNLQ